MDDLTKKVEKELDSLSDKVSSTVKDVVAFVKKHKKIIVAIVAIYFVYKFLFDEGEN